MSRIRTALEELHGDLERLNEQYAVRKDELERELTKQAEALKVSRGREANAMALSQKIATKIDHTIERVERLLAVPREDQDYA